MTKQTNEEGFINQIRRLRDCTACGMDECKEALNKFNRDFEKAKEYLRQNGLAVFVTKKPKANEELKTKLYKIMSKDLVLSAKTHIEVLNAIDEIMSLIPQPEQLEVYLNGGLGINGAAYAVDYINPHGDPMCLLWAKSKQEALDFAMKYNLKVINEEKE